MNNKQKSILIFIFIMIFIIAILFVLLYSQYNNIDIKYSNSVNIDSEKSDTLNDNVNLNNIDLHGGDTGYIEKDVEITYTKKLSYVNDRYDYFTIKNIFNEYVERVTKNRKVDLKNILSPNYLNKYNVTDENIINKLIKLASKNQNGFYILTIDEILKAEIDDITNIYILRAKYRIISEESKVENINILIQVDKERELYYIYPEEYMEAFGYNQLKVNDIIDYKREKILDNIDNIIKEKISKNDEEMAKEYFNSYKELIMYYQDEAYEKLDKEYATKRFGNKENFKQYLNENKQIFNISAIEQYKVISEGDDIYYICADQYEKLYIFKLKDGIMNYSVLLDNYTIMLEQDKEAYDKANKKDKTRFNLGRFINMLNTKDYKAIYNCLDSNFRQTNFPTVEDLKKYLNENLYKINSCLVNDLNTSNDDYIVYKCSIVNKLNKDEGKTMFIVIQPGEGINFTMSFSFE